MRWRWAVVAALCPCLSALAQDAPVSSHRLYGNPASYVLGARALSLGGAYVAAAEGVAYTANTATLAQPSPWLDDTWGVDLSFEASVTPGAQDLDNDGLPDGEASRQALVGVGARIGRFGFGIFGRSSQRTVCPGAGCAGGARTLFTDLGYVGFVAAFSTWRDQLVWSAGAFGNNLRLSRTGFGREYAGAALGADVLYRPHGQRFRLGATFRGQQYAALVPGGVGALPDEAPLPRAMVSPAVLTAGAAIKLDEGGEGFNDPRPRDDDPTAVLNATQVLREAFRSRHEKPPGRWLLTVQLDTVFPVKDALPMDAFLDRTLKPQIATRAMFTPRLGVEHVTAPGRLRLRAGTYLEPSAFPEHGPRLHVTAGFDLFLFHYLFDWGVSGAGDVANNVSQGGVSFGVWH